MKDEQELKRLIGEYVVEKHVRSGMKIGLGSGTTAIYAVRSVARLFHDKKLESIRCCCTGEGTRHEALALGLPCTYLDDPLLYDLDLAIDGADEYDDQGYLLKGGGGCHLYEKLVAYRAQKCVIIVNDSKHVKHLALRAPLPVEVVPSFRIHVEKELRKQYKVESIVLRNNAKKIGPWVTEEGNFIIDLVLKEAVDPAVHEDKINTILGVVENGFFSKKRVELVSIDSDGKISQIS